MEKLAIKRMIETKIEEEKRDFSEFELLVDAAEFDSGRINKHLLKHLPEGCEYYIKYNMYYIKFPSGNEHLLGWVGTTKELTVESLRRSDSCYSNGSEGRIKQLENISELKIHLVFNRLEAAIKELKTAYGNIEKYDLDSHNNPLFYELCDKIGLTDKIRHEF
ncbi:MAG: hypothetical protein WC677_08375 [Clostridia bacterium]|jgi:hypothetical protein